MWKAPLCITGVGVGVGDGRVEWDLGDDPRIRDR